MHRTLRRRHHASKFSLGICTSSPRRPLYCSLRKTFSRGFCRPSIRCCRHRRRCVRRSLVSCTRSRRTWTWGPISQFSISSPCNHQSSEAVSLTPIKIPFLFQKSQSPFQQSLFLLQLQSSLFPFPCLRLELLNLRARLAFLFLSTLTEACGGTCIARALFVS